MSARLARLLRASRWQLGSLAAVALGFVIVFGAQALDGGTVRSLFQLRAALIVFGGTLAATLISYSPRAMMDATSLGRAHLRPPGRHARYAERAARVVVDSRAPARAAGARARSGFRSRSVSPQRAHAGHRRCVERGAPRRAQRRAARAGRAGRSAGPDLRGRGRLRADARASSAPCSGSSA